jgi:hypothetical protein
MNHHTRASGNLERRIHDAESNLFAAVSHLPRSATHLG